MEVYEKRAQPVTPVIADFCMLAQVRSGRGRAMKRATFNERGYRVGETRLNSKLSDHDVTLIVGLLNARLEVIEQCQSIGMRQGEIDRALAFKQLSYRWIADKFEVSKMTVKSIADGRTRCHAIVHTKRGK